VTDALQDLGIGGGDATDKLTEATTRYNEAQKTFNALAADKKLKTDEGREATRQLRDAQDDLERVTNRVNVAHEEEITKLEQVKQSTYDVVLQKMGLEGAQIAVERATAAYNKTMGDSEATDLAKREATLSATTAIMAMAQKQLELEGQTTETEAGQKRLNEILTYIAGTLDSASPLRARLQDYANDLRGIPTDVVTSFRVRLDTNEIYNQLQDLGLSGEQAAEMIRQSYQYLLPGLAAGGVVTGPTVAMIGEAGPEAVIPLSQLPSMVPQTGGGSMSITVPLVVDGRVLAEVTASELNRPGGPVIKQRAIV
jgi:chromosome segregation ATPase